MAASLLDGINTGLGIARTRMARQESEAQRAAREAEQLAINDYRNRQLASIDEDRKNDNQRLQAAADLAKQQREEDAAFAQAVGQAMQGQSYDEMPMDWQGPVKPGKSASEAISGALAKGKGANSKQVDALLRAEAQREAIAQREAAADSLDRYRQGRLDQQDQRIEDIANQSQKEAEWFSTLGTKLAPPAPFGEGPEMPAKPYDRAMAETMAEKGMLPRGMRAGVGGRAATDPGFKPQVITQDGVRLVETGPGKFQQIIGDGNPMKGHRRVTRTDPITRDKIVEYVPIETPATPEEMDNLKSIIAENKRKTAEREGKGQMSIPLNPANGAKWTEGKLPNGKTYRIKQSE